MGDFIQLDLTELTELITSYDRSTKGVRASVQRSVAKAGVKLRNKLRKDVRKSTHFKKISRTITFDLIDRGMGVVVGPLSRRQGKLAHIAYFGGVRGGGGTVPDPAQHLPGEAEQVEQVLKDIVQELLSYG